MKRLKPYLLIFLALAAAAALAALFLLVPGNDGNLTSTGGDSKCAPVAGMTTAFIDESGDQETLGYVDSRKIVRGPDGRLYAAYRKKADGSDDFQIFVSVSDDGLSWSLANGGRAISEGTGYDQRVPSLFFRGNTLHVAWYGADRDSADNTNRHEIKYSSSSDGGSSFTPWHNIGVVDGYDGEEEWQEHPVINGGPDTGDPLYLVWEGKDRDHDNQQIKFSRSGDGGRSWSGPANVQPTPGRSQSRPTVLVDGDRLVLFAYGTRDANGNANNGDNGRGSDIITTSSTDGGDSWQEWTTLSVNGEDNRHVTALMDAQKNLHLAYRRYDGERSRVVYGFSSDGSEWVWSEAPAVNDNNQFFPSLTEVGDQGIIYLAWSEQSGAAQAPREKLSDDAISLLGRVTIEQEINRDLSLGGFWITTPPRSPFLEFLYVSDGGTNSLCYAGSSLPR